MQKPEGKGEQMLNGVRFCYVSVLFTIYNVIHSSNLCILDVVAIMCLKLMFLVFVLCPSDQVP